MTKLVNALKNRKSQITMFIILGLIVLALFGFVYFAVQEKAEKDIQSQVRIAYSRLSEQAFSNYVETCLNHILEQGTLKLAKQGGYFYNNSGFIYAPEYKIPNHNNIAFAIYEQKYPDKYPCRTNDNYPDYCRYPNQTTNIFLGKNNLPSLVVIKRQLEKYVVDEILKNNSCADLDWIKQNFPQFANYNFSVNKNATNAEIKLLASSIKVTLEYPIMLKIGDSEPVMEFLYFTSDIKTSFSRIHSFVQSVVENEIKNLDYKATQQNLNSLANSNNLNININKNSNRFSITDKNFISTANNELVFNFIVQNRPPVLDYIHKREHPQDYNNKDLYDYLAIEGEQINLSPSYQDPDEDDSLSLSKPSLPSSIGWHNITVNVTDGNLNDSQTVRILIDNKLKPDFNIYAYKEFPGTISLEDPVYINASATENSLDPYAIYYYDYLFNLNPDYKKYSYESILEIPVDNSLLFNSNPGIYNLTLNATIIYPNYNYSDSTTKKFNLTQCIPMENHLCCNNDFTIADTSAVCNINPVEKICKETMLYSKTADVTYCDGINGNICNGTTKLQKKEISLNICGYENCGVHKKCVEKSPYALIKNKGKCYGETGCESFCKDSLFSDKSIVINNNKLECGCNADNEGKNCDTDFDGDYNGVCKNSKCTGDE